MQGISFRAVRPTDIPDCAEIEAASYPEDEAASKSSLQYRQHHAAKYFRCAVLVDEENEGNDDHETIIGFVCSTRCNIFEHESMSTHLPTGTLLAIHSVVVRSDYRRKGIATAMLQDYIQNINEMNIADGGSIEKVVLLAKEHLLAFYVKCGFSVVSPSAINHGQDQWYDLQLMLDTSALKEGKAYYVADAFADPSLPGTGNPAALVILDEAFDLNGKQERRWMQTVALEFNLSETAFVAPVVDQTTAEDVKDNELHYHIRYFTPKKEVPLCGHATLASAATLFRTLHLKSETSMTIVFHAKEDVLKASLAGGKVRTMCSKVSMDFPMKPATELMSFIEQTAIQVLLSKAFKIEPNDILYYGLSDEIGDVLVEVTPDCFHKLGFEGLNIDALSEWDGYDRGIIVCCAAPERDNNSESGLSTLDETSSKSESVEPIQFYSRFFAPKAGIPEDPVTGSAHCVLGPHFFSRVGCNKLVGYQSSERGGLVECEKVDDKRIRLSGNVVTSMNGVLLLKFEE